MYLERVLIKCIFSEFYRSLRLCLVTDRPNGKVRSNGSYIWFDILPTKICGENAAWDCSNGPAKMWNMLGNVSWCLTLYKIWSNISQTLTCWVMFNICARQDEVITPFLTGSLATSIFKKCSHSCPTAHNIVQIWPKKCEANLESNVAPFWTEGSFAQLELLSAIQT